MEHARVFIGFYIGVATTFVRLRSFAPAQRQRVCYAYTVSQTSLGKPNVSCLASLIYGKARVNP